MSTAVQHSAVQKRALQMSYALIKNVVDAPKNSNRDVQINILSIEQNILIPHKVTSIRH